MTSDPAVTPVLNLVIRADWWLRGIATRLELRELGLKQASRVFTHMTLAERKQLFRLASDCPSGARVLEIGSHVGASACFIAAGLRGKGGRLYCVDTWHNETMPDGEKDTFGAFEANVAPFASLITAIRKRSDALVATDLQLPLDLAFVDGDHSEEAVAADFRLVEAWLKPGGVAVFHDFLYFPGVARVVGRALASGSWVLDGFVDNMVWLKRPAASA